MSLSQTHSLHYVLRNGEWKENILLYDCVFYINLFINYVLILSYETHIYTMDWLHTHTHTHTHSPTHTHTHRSGKVTSGRPPKPGYKDVPPPIPVHSTPRGKPPLPVHPPKSTPRDNLPPVIPAHKPTPRSDSSVLPPLPAPREKPPLPPVPVRDTTG